MKCFAALLCLAIAASAAAQNATTVTIDSGRIQGAVADGVLSFKGVPFAQPPVGPLRWRAPQPVTAWSDVRKATTYANDCMQEPYPSDAAPLGTKPAEDCLYVNIWEPAQRTGEKLPVMVWIYGGGFVNGGSSPAVYDGSQFAKKGIVFVSFNYRVGRFGFFAHPALTAENADHGLLGNYTFMDQIAAMQWVKRNAAAFGGDANNVTLFGESAGGGSVHMFLTSPLAEGLYNHVVVESGGGRARTSRYLSTRLQNGMDSGEAVGMQFAQSQGITGTGPEALAALRKLPAEAVRGNLNMATSRNNFYGGPVVDGKIVIADNQSVYISGANAHVPIMIGTNSADAGTVNGDTADAVFASYGVDRHAAEAAYGSMSGNLKSLKANMGSDRGMAEPARFVGRVFAAEGQPVYIYRFSYVADSLKDKWPGALHATEIPFVFDTVKARYEKDLTAHDEKIAQQTLNYWANFAKTGDPNGDGQPQWQKYTRENESVMDITGDGPQPKTDPWKARLDVQERYNTANPATPMPRTVPEPRATPVK